MAVHLTLQQVEELTQRALVASHVREDNARAVTRSVVASEADGIHSHGLARLPTYCEHARCGKIDGHADPAVERVAPGGTRVDARAGFAHPAIDRGLEAWLPRVGEQGSGGLAITNSYNCGVVGYHVERIAEAGYIALGFVNAPASIAPWGGANPVFGTNPLACAIPRAATAPLVIDQSSSVVAKSEIVVHKQRGEAIPEGWALDADGQPTTDPEAALQGSMVPMGGYKGAGIALIVEIMAAALTGSHLAIEASSFATNEGGSPRTGQFFLGIDPGVFAGADFGERLEKLVAAIDDQEGTRLPGQGRLKARERTQSEGIEIAADLYERLRRYAEAT
jgi:(2R)-3-sulfolactate dehydrogenase (NADP+)